MVDTHLSASHRWDSQLVSCSLGAVRLLPRPYYPPVACLMVKANYNLKAHVASYIAIGNKYLPPENIQSQSYIHNIEEWTQQKEMKLNVQKSKYMLINFTREYKVNSRAYIQFGLQGIKQYQLKIIHSFLCHDLKFCPSHCT